MTKNCQRCNNEFTPGTYHPNQKFCSRECKVKNEVFRRSKKGSLGTTDLFNEEPATSIQQPVTTQPMHTEPKPVKAAPLQLPNGISDSATFMIKFIEKDRDRFETLYNEERTTRKKLKEEKEKLEKQIAELKQTHELEKISNAKPTGLSGLSENPTVIKLLDHIGPALGKLAERFADNVTAPSQQLAGNDGPLQFAQWLATKSESTQAYVLELLTGLTQIPDENTLIQRLSAIKQMVMGDYMRATG